jgi:hypothetical protein
VTTSSGTPIHTQVRLTGGLPVRFARRGAPLLASRSPPRQAHQRRGGLARPWLNVDDAWCEALFASALQRSAAPTAESVAAAISRAVRRFGTRGCVSRMAQEFGDHPQAAAERMRWVRQLATEAAIPATCEISGAELTGRAAVQARKFRARIASPSQAARLDTTHERLTALKHEGGTLATYLANYGLFYLEADLRWIDMTAARLDALAREVRK